MMAVGDASVFPGFLTPVLTLLFFPKSPTTFLTCFYRGERRKYAGKKSPLNQGSNSQPQGHESNTLTTEPPGRDQSQLHPTDFCTFLKLLALFQSSPGFYVSHSSTSLLKRLWDKEKLLVMSNFSFSHSVFTHLENILQFRSKLKWSSANRSSFEKSKICCLGEGQLLQSTNNPNMFWKNWMKCGLYHLN